MSALTVGDFLQGKAETSPRLPPKDNESDPLPSIDDVDDGSERLLVTLCPACQRFVDNLDFFLERLDVGSAYVRLEDPPRAHQPLAIFARKGCGLCQAVALGLHNNSWPTIHHSIITSEDEDPNRRLDHFCLRRNEGDQNDLGFIFRAEWEFGSFISTVLFFPRESIYPAEYEVSTAARTSLAFAKRSLEACTTSHHKCLPPDIAFSPTRLIEICKDGCRLRTDILFGTPYTTLSHCWGTNDIFKLKRDNIDDLQNNIPLEELSKTFQDAILVTQSLGFSYIWIDSVCIIQDNVDDWRTESAKMSQVYGNSSVNIAATLAKNGSIGLFAERDTMKMRSQYISTPRKKLFEFAPTGFYARCISSAPLTNRAWTFQERHLAERTMHFTSEQIMWECRDKIACETLPDGIPMAMIPRFDVFPSTVNPDDWCQTVSIYSRAKLTYGTDKLMAISGVARKFQERTPDQYLAGLWRRNIGRQLCWRKHEPNGTHESDSTPYRAPSWSWASTDCPVTWRLWTTNNASLIMPGQKIFIEILEFHAILAGSDEIGQIESAELQVKCGALIEVDALTWFDGKLYYDTEERESSRNGSGCYLLPTVGMTRRDDAFNDEKSKMTAAAEEPASYGLIVEKVEHRGKGYFARVGVYDIDLGVAIYQDSITGLDSDHSRIFMDESFYQEVLEPNSDGHKQYSITLL